MHENQFENVKFWHVQLCKLRKKKRLCECCLWKKIKHRLWIFCTNFLSDWKCARIGDSTFEPLTLIASFQSFAQVFSSKLEPIYIQHEEKRIFLLISTSIVNDKLSLLFSISCLSENYSRVLASVSSLCTKGAAFTISWGWQSTIAPFTSEMFAFKILFHTFVVSELYWIVAAEVLRSDVQCSFELIIFPWIFALKISLSTTASFDISTAVKRTLSQNKSGS